MARARVAGTSVIVKAGVAGTVHHMISSMLRSQPHHRRVSFQTESGTQIRRQIRPAASLIVGYITTGVMTLFRTSVTNKPATAAGASSVTATSLATKS